MFLFIWYVKTDGKILCIVLFWSECSTLVPLCTFVRHPLKIHPTAMGTRHFLYYPEVFANAMLLGSLKQVLWKELLFYACYLHDKVTRLLRTKVQTKASILKFYSQILFLILFFFLTLSFLCECSKFFFINEIFKTKNLSRSMFLY